MAPWVGSGNYWKGGKERSGGSLAGDEAWGAAGYTFDGGLREDVGEVGDKEAGKEKAKAGAPVRNRIRASASSRPFSQAQCGFTSSLPPCAMQWTRGCMPTCTSRQSLVFILVGRCPGGHLVLPEVVRSRPRLHAPEKPRRLHCQPASEVDTWSWHRTSQGMFSRHICPGK